MNEYKLINQDGKYNFCNQDGNLLSKKGFIYAEDFKDGFALVVIEDNLLKVKEVIIGIILIIFLLLPYTGILLPNESSGTKGELLFGIAFILYYLVYFKTVGKLSHDENINNINYIDKYGNIVNSKGFYRVYYVINNKLKYLEFDKKYGISDSEDRYIDDSDKIIRNLKKGKCIALRIEKPYYGNGNNLYNIIDENKKIYLKHWDSNLDFLRL